MTDYQQVRAVAVPAADGRLTVGGVDVTYFRDVPTPIPEYQLTEPFGYGPTTLVFPQVDAQLEMTSYGSGELSWVKEGARVAIQRIDGDLNVVATDYVGEVLSIGVSGRDLSLEVGGEFSGAASRLIKNRPLTRRVRDVGFWFANAVERLHFGLENRYGPTTGITMIEGGGGYLLDWASDICAWSQTATGQQRSIMPIEWGEPVYGFEFKDTTTVHMTAFTDDAAIVPRLRRDTTEIPTTWYGTGVSPDGVRWKNARYPGVLAGPAPTFPGPMSLGDTDADTTTGSGVTVLNEKLVAMGYLSTDGLVYGTYGPGTVAAVKELQDDGGRPQTGAVDSDTWDDLYDNNVTGFSASDAHIAPLVQDPRVRQYNYTSNGSIAGLNPLYDLAVKPVERFIEFGPGVTKAQAIAWCRGEWTKLSGDNWFGEIEMNGLTGFAGDWTTADYEFLNDPTTGAEFVMPHENIRPGMNVRLPMFGNILVHVSGVRVNKQDKRVTLTVDTLARDLLDLAALMSRDTEARRNIRREFRVDHRPNKRSGAMIERDEYFGILDRDVTLYANRWNFFPVPAGQEGVVKRIRIRTTDDEAEYSVLVLKHEPTEERLDNRIGNPLVISAESVLERESLHDWLDSKNILYAAGDGKQPCGYFPRRHRDDDGNVTDAPITGRHTDDGGFDYECDPKNALIVWVAIYPDRDCTVKRGQLLYAQENDVI